MLADAGVEYNTLRMRSGRVGKRNSCKHFNCEESGYNPDVIYKSETLSSSMTVTNLATNGSWRELRKRLVARTIKYDQFCSSQLIIRWTKKGSEPNPSRSSNLPFTSWFFCWKKTEAVQSHDTLLSKLSYCFIPIKCQCHFVEPCKWCFDLPDVRLRDVK